MNLLTSKDVVDSLSNYPVEAPVPAPAYSYHQLGPKMALAVPSMARHTSDEGWQLMLALQAGGYDLCGCGLSSTNVSHLLAANPSVVMVQDQHEWDSGHLAKREEYFHNFQLLASRPDVFKLTVVKDTHRQYESSKRYAVGIGSHAIVIYYHPAIVLRTLNWLRPEHVIRTYHTLNPDNVPPYESKGRRACLLSGSLGGAYPLRTRIHEARLPDVAFLPHPGYHNTRTYTPEYINQLSNFKVAICTASKFGYALRKHMEATAAGCRVITDLPTDEVLPTIDENLTRISPSISMPELRQLIRKLCDEYDPAKQEEMAKWAKLRYDYRTEGKRLAAEIERVRMEYK